MAVEPGLLHPAPVFGLAVAGERNQTRRQAAGVPDLSGNGVPVLSRESEVHQDHIERVFDSTRGPLDAVTGHLDLMAFGFQQHAEHLASIHVVLDDQDPAATCAVAG